MTQEDIRRARQILQNNGIEQLDKDDYFFKSIIKSMNDYTQQPIPQDINIEAEAKKYTQNLPESLWKGKLCITDIEIGYEAGANLLLPQLQAQQVELIHRGNIIELNRVEIESLKQENERLKEEKDLFAMNFSVWLYGAEGQMYMATKMPVAQLLATYKDRPFINTFDPENQ